MPELPEVEALRRALDEPVSSSSIRQAGPAHVATLKTFDPPLAALEGRRFRGAERRGKNLLFRTIDEELVLHIHLMSAGRLRLREPEAKQPNRPAFRLLFDNDSSLILTEAGSKKRARVGLYTREAIEAELEHLGPEALGLSVADLTEILESESRRLHPLLRDQRALAGIGRAWSNEILHRARLSPFALSTELDTEQIERLATTIEKTLTEGVALRERGAGDRKAYRIHNRLGEPCPACATPIERVDFEEHTIYYCPQCQTGGRILKDRRLSRLLK